MSKIAATPFQYRSIHVGSQIGSIGHKRGMRFTNGDVRANLKMGAPQNLMTYHVDWHVVPWRLKNMLQKNVQASSTRRI